MNIEDLGTKDRLLLELASVAVGLFTNHNEGFNIFLNNDESLSVATVNSGDEQQLIVEVSPEGEIRAVHFENQEDSVIQLAFSRAYIERYKINSNWQERLRLANDKRISFEDLLNELNIGSQIAGKDESKDESVDGYLFSISVWGDKVVALAKRNPNEEMSVDYENLKEFSVDGDFEISYSLPDQEERALVFEWSEDGYLLFTNENSTLDFKVESEAETLELDVHESGVRWKYFAGPYGKLICSGTV